MMLQCILKGRLRWTHWSGLRNREPSMDIYQVARAVLLSGSIFFGAGVIALTALQSHLTGKLGRSLWTMLSVMFFPDHELTDGERRVKRVGNYLIYIGAVTILI